MVFEFEIPTIPRTETAQSLPHGGQAEIGSVQSLPTSIPTHHLSIAAGESVIFVGANGAGKTRLAVHIEQSLGAQGHRISAHRALALDPSVPKVTEEQALRGLRFGNLRDEWNIELRATSRWDKQPAVALLNDFDFLTQALFAEQNNKAIKSHKLARSGATAVPEPTKFERLCAVWERLLPHRKLDVTADNITVTPPGGAEAYNASHMSDGERAVFYLIGQALMADPDTMLIIDEPELHVHPSIMAKLWDAVEAERPDCAFVFITHDLEFAAQRAAQKFVVSNYDGSRWSLEPVPEDTGFCEATTTLILGSRRPILFVEGDDDSLDSALYRCCFPDWTVVPRGSCEQVIHSVTTMRANSELHRTRCAGIVDADGQDDSDRNRLRELGIEILPVSEIENLLFLPEVSRALAETEGHTGTDADAVLEALNTKIISFASEHLDGAVVRYCRRRIDREVKRLDFGSARSEIDLAVAYANRTREIDVGAIATEYRAQLNQAIAARDIPALLALFDNKGLLQLAAAELKGTSKSKFEGWVTRVLRGNKHPAVKSAIATFLPQINAEPAS